MNAQEPYLLARVPLLEPDADERLYGVLSADFADPVLPHPSARRWVRPPMYHSYYSTEWTRVGKGDWRYTPHKEPRRAEPVRRPPKPWEERPRRQKPNLRFWPMPLAHETERPEYRRAYLNMDDLENDARLFCYGVGSRYFADVYDALRIELSRNGLLLQIEALDTLVSRLRQMRDLLEQRLPTPATREASTIQGESVEVSESEAQHVSG
jgi:hypothetical protein